MSAHVEFLHVKVIVKLVDGTDFAGHLRAVFDDDLLLDNQTFGPILIRWAHVLYIRKYVL